MLIGICGKLNSGKDTTYGAIKELRPEAEKITFATKIKEAAAAVLNIDQDSLEYMKNDPKIRYSPMCVGWGGGPLPYKARSFSIREFLQNYGKAHRDIFGENFWLDQVLPDDLNHNEKLIVVTDVRLPNEIERVIQLGGYTTRVSRSSNTSRSDHETEQDIPDELIDWGINNDGTQEELKENIKEMLTAFEEGI